MRTEKQQTLQRLVNLIQDVGPLHTISRFGFGLSPDPSGDLERLKHSPLWALIDLRGTQAPEQLRFLVDHWHERVLVLVVEGDPSLPLYRFVKGMIEKRQQFDLGDGATRTRRDDQTVVVVFPRAKSLQDVPKSYHEIPYWSMKEFR